MMAVPRRKAKHNALQRNIVNLRKLLRRHAVLFAQSHRGCAVARGCGCAVDQILTLLDETEQDLFRMEIASYAVASSLSGYSYYLERDPYDVMARAVQRPE